MTVDIEKNSRKEWGSALAAAPTALAIALTTQRNR